jgi:hypothetical protein
MSNTIRIIKEKMSEKLGRPEQDQVLFYAGKKLNNELTLSDCNIQKESTLYLSLKQKPQS